MSNKTRNQRRETCPHAERMAEKAAIQAIRFEQIESSAFYGLYDLRTMLDYLDAIASTGKRSVKAFNIPAGIVTALRMEKFNVSQVAMAASDYAEGKNHDSTKWKISW